MGSTTAPLDFTLSDLEKSNSRSSDVETLSLIKEHSPYVTIKHEWETYL